MIRAHLATFPPRRRILRRVTDAILPQVDHLFVVLNDYDTVPGFLARDPKVTAVIPDRDMKAAGKFWFAPAPDDIVFCIDDDIGYPPDYVARTLALIEPMGLDGNVYGYHGHAFAPGSGGGYPVWHNYLFRHPLDRVRGATVLGTGTLCARGDALPPLSEVEAHSGSVDFAYGRWLHRQTILPWMLPREAEWLRNALPQNLRATSLFATVRRANHPEHRAVLAEFAARWPHAHIPFDDYHAPALQA